jgi:hypothetical protein
MMRTADVLREGKESLDRADHRLHPGHVELSCADQYSRGVPLARQGRTTRPHHRQRPSPIFSSRGPSRRSPPLQPLCATGTPKARKSMRQRYQRTIPIRVSPPACLSSLRLSSRPLKRPSTFPVEAVYSREGASYIKIDTGKDAFEERKVKTGRFSADFIELTEGVKEGDRVLLIRTTL